MRAAISAHDEGSNVVILSAQGLGNSNSDSYSSGLAASLNENNSMSHRNDTIKGGDWLNDQDIVSKRTALINSHIAQLDQWGLNFRRSLSGTPEAEKGLGHKTSRVLTTGDSTAREVQHILEEQCIRRNILRRGDWLPLSLGHSNGQVTGVIALDMIEGVVASLQAKAVIIADDGFESAWNLGNSSSRGLSIALDAGCQLRDLEFITWNPLGVPDTELSLSLDLLANGAKVTTSSGSEIEITPELTPNNLATEINNAGGVALLDATSLSKTAIDWYAGIKQAVKDRTGLDMSEQAIPVSPRVEQTLGGLPVDEHGRVVRGNWDKWYTGLYSAGSASCSGLNGAGSIAGNRLMEDLVGGSSAGMHAGKWVKKKNFSGADSLNEASFSAEAMIVDMLSHANTENTSNTSALKLKLSKLVSSNMGFERSLEGLQEVESSLENLESDAEQIQLVDNSMFMNTNLADALELQGLISITRASVAAAISRSESRGSHQRTDCPERIDETMLKHTLVDSTFHVNWLPLRKSGSDTWILTPSN